VVFVDAPVRVSVPATSANLGPGFDSLGLALELRDELTASVTGEGLRVEVVGEGAGHVSRDETHLVVRAMRATFGALGGSPDGLVLSCHNRIPHARGLGSSSAAIVGGIALARALVADGAERLDDGRALAIATAIEGHPDNVAPAISGGFTISGQAGMDVWTERPTVDDRVRAVAFVPPHGLSTDVARALLPATVPHADAAANAGRAALLVAALAYAPERLLRATEDFLHQEYRRRAMPESLALVDRLRDDDHAALVSGAGPTVLVLTTATDLDALTTYRPEGWNCLPLEIAADGVRVLEAPGTY
jgi:homoserine kinase